MIFPTETCGPEELAEVPVMEKKCVQHMQPVRDALDILSGKWKLPIIIGLVHGSFRFKELERMIDGITPRMLSKELKELEINQLVKRTVYNTMPVTVNYELTAYGDSLKPVIEALAAWGTAHRNRIMSKTGKGETAGDI